MHKLSAVYPRNAGFNIQTSINVTHHVNKQKKKNHMNGIEKVSGKVQHSFR